MIRRFASDAGWIVGLRIASLPLQLLLFLLVARYHSLAEVGLYALCNAGWMITRQLGPLGLEQAALRFGPTLLAQDRDGEARWLERRSRLIVLAVCGGVAVVFWLLADLVIAGSLTSDRLLLALVALTGPGYALLPLYASQLRARKLVRRAQLPDFLVLPLLVMALLQIFHLTVGSSLYWMIAAHFIAVWCVVAIYVVADAGGGSVSPVALAAGERREIRSAAGGLMLSGAVNVASIRLPLFLVQAVLGAPSAALFEAGQRLGALGTLSTWGANAAVSPMLAEARARGDEHHLQHLVVVSSWAAFLPSLGLLLLLAVAGEFILGLFGDAYRDGFGVLLLLSAATMVNASGGSSSGALNMMGRERTVLTFNLLQVVLLAGLVPLLTEVYGLEGAAAAVLLGAIVRDVGISLMLKRQLGLLPGLWSPGGWAIMLGYCRGLLRR